MQTSEINNTKDCVLFLAGETCAHPYEIEHFVAERCDIDLIEQAVKIVNGEELTPADFDYLMNTDDGSDMEDAKAFHLICQFIGLPSVSRNTLLSTMPSMIALHDTDLDRMGIDEGALLPCSYREAGFPLDGFRSFPVYSLTAASELI